jgi:hypothetical protein
VGLEHFPRGASKGCKQMAGGCFLVGKWRVYESFGWRNPGELDAICLPSLDILLVFGRIGFSCLKGQCRVVDLGIYRKAKASLKNIRT